MSAGSKIRDDEGEQFERYSRVDTFPDGSSIEVYSSHDNQRMVFRHSSGSHLEFKADGSVFLKAIKDLHMHGSPGSTQSNSLKGADKTTQRYDTDVVIDVHGRLMIKAAEFDLDVGSTARCKAGTDFIISGNNVIEKATESISLEGTKSVYIDTKELKERVVYTSREQGTDEDKGEGGLDILKLNGRAVIMNDDKEGGISIITKGYLNLVCGQERVDIAGKYTERPESEAEATFTTKVFQPQPAAQQNVEKPGGTYYIETEGSEAHKICTKEAGEKFTPNGRFVEVVKGDNREQTKEGDKYNLIKEGDMYKQVQQGKYESKVKKDEKWEVDGERTRKVKKNEKVEITGQQKIKAKKIFLN